MAMSHRTAWALQSPKAEVGKSAEVSEPYKSALPKGNTIEMYMLLLWRLQKLREKTGGTVEAPERTAILSSTFEDAVLRGGIFF